MNNNQAVSSFSSFGSVDDASDPMDYIRRLDERSARPFWREIKSRVIGLLEVSEGKRVLDIGCGTGDDVRVIAQLTGSKGVVIGVDSSTIMLKEAKRRIKGTKLPIKFYLGDAHKLDFPNESFDCCRAERILQHIENPRQAISEMIRVTKPGGRIACVEPDYGSTVITGGEQLLTQCLLSHFWKQYRNERIGILLPLYFMQFGLENVSVEIKQRIRSEYTNADGDFLLEKYVNPALQANLITQSDGKRWIEDIRTAGEKGNYAHILNIFIVTSSK